MPEQRTPEPAEHVGGHKPAPPETVRGLAEAIAEQIESRQAAEGNALSGKFDLDIVYDGVEYILTVKAPVAVGDDPGYWSVLGTRTIVENNDKKEFLNFEFKDQNNWTAGLGIPKPFTFPNTSLEIKQLYAKFSMGEVKPPQQLEAED